MDMSDPVSDVQVSDLSEHIVNWTKLEKFHLLEALKKEGSTNVDSISQKIRSKTQEEIENALKYYQSKASERLNCSAKHFRRTQKKKKTKDNNAPVTSWAKILTNSYSHKELETDTGAALRLISQFEKFPCPIMAEDVDLNNIYLLLANAVDGRPLPEVNDSTAHTITNCMLETISESQNFFTNTDLINCITSMSLTNKAILVRPIATNDVELANLQHLTSQSSYNPLGVSVNFLKGSNIPNPAATLKCNST